MTITRQQTTTGHRDGRDQVLVEPEWLQEHLHDPGLRIVEVDVSAAMYTAGHIQGAVLWNVYTDLKDGDYATIDATAFTRLVRGCGIQPQSTVVLYGYAPAMGLWLLRLFGHHDVRILNCSRDEWIAVGGSLTAATPPIPATEYVLRGRDDRIGADPAQVQAAINDPRVTIVDVRSAAERETTALQEVFGDLDLSDDAPILTYCTIGGRASTAWFALTYLLGRTNVAVYDGSWAQWGRTPGAPVARA